MFKVFIKTAILYERIKNWLKSFFIIEKRAYLYEDRLIYYYKKNALAYIYDFFSCSWYLIFLTVIYYDLDSLYTYIIILLIMFFFYKNYLPKKIIEFILLLIGIAKKEETDLFSRLFAYSLLMIIFLSSYLSIYPLIFIRILFAIRTFVSLSVFMYYTYPSISLNFLFDGVIRDKDLLDFLHPTYKILNNEEVKLYDLENKITNFNKK